MEIGEIFIEHEPHFVFGWMISIAAGLYSNEIIKRERQEFTEPPASE